MKKIICGLLLIMLFSSPCYGRELQVRADSAMLLNTETMEVLWEKNAEKSLAPASLIKLLNILTAYPYIDFADTVTVGALVDTLYAGQLIHLHQGDLMTTEEIIYAMMLYSANDAAVAMADYLVSDIDFYAALMDKKAWALGAMDTCSVNVNGYSDARQKTTVGDLAVIACAYQEKEALMTFASAKNHTLTWKSPQKEIEMANINRFLLSYEGATGLKTGTADLAGKCLIATAKRGETSLTAIVLNSSKRYEDCMLMMDYGFANGSRGE